MQARKLSDTRATPIQLSLRIRHPAIDPETLSRTLALEFTLPRSVTRVLSQLGIAIEFIFDS
jgi:hypothetical protein